MPSLPNEQLVRLKSLKQVKEHVIELAEAVGKTPATGRFDVYGDLDVLIETLENGEEE